MRALDSAADEVERRSRGERVGRYSEDAPAEGGGGVVFLHIPQEATGARVSSLRPHATLYLDGDLMLGYGVVEAPATHGVKFQLTDAGDAQVTPTERREEITRGDVGGLRFGFGLCHCSAT